MNHLSYTDLIAMLGRIKPEEFRDEMLAYLKTQEGVSEVRLTVQGFLQFYVRKRP